ncbi:MAG: EamA family transporter, partial [Rhodobacteraceae bacterium]|nr:EamA family transporter [Paracoccaceae bacterium]
METRQNSDHNPIAAAGFILLASAIFGGVTLLAKMVGREGLGEPLNPLQVSHARFLFAFVAIGGTSLAMRLRLHRPDLRLHFLRSFAGWGGVSLLFAAVAFIPLTDATAISFLNPVFAMVLAILLLGERVGRWRWLAAGIALCGGLVLLRPGAGSFQPASLLALSAAMVMGLEITIIKMLAGRERPLQILLINNAMGLVIASVAVVFIWQPPTPVQWAALVPIGFMMAVGQACCIQAMRRA